MINSKQFPPAFKLAGVASAILLASLPLGGAQAIEYKLTAGFSSERTDNVGRASDESELKQKDWIHKPTLRGEASHEGPNLLIDADYLVEHRIYTEDVFDDRTRFTGRADLRWEAVPELLQLNVTNSRTEATQDALGQDIETNRQITNVISAGPRLLFRPRPRDQISLEYRYSDVSQTGVQGFGGTNVGTQADIDADSDRQLIRAAYELGLSENRSLTLELSRDKVEFNRDTSPELEIDTAALAYSSKGDALEIDVRGGYTTIDRTLNRSKVDGAIGNLDLLWRVSGSGQITASARRTINDQSSNVLRGNGEFGQGSVFENTDLNEVFEEDILQLGYTHRWGRNTARLTYSLQNQDYDDTAFTQGNSRDQDEDGFRVFYSRRVTPRIDLRMTAGLLDREFEDRGITEDYLSADLQIDWRAGRALTLFGGASYEDRDASGTDSLQASQLSFDEFIFRIGFTFDIVDRTKLTQER